MGTSSQPEAPGAPAAAGDPFDPSDSVIDDVIDAAFGEDREPVSRPNKPPAEVYVESITHAFDGLFDETSGAFIPPPGLESSLQPQAEVEDDYDVAIFDDDDDEEEAPASIATPVPVVDDLVPPPVSSANLVIPTPSPPSAAAPPDSAVEPARVSAEVAIRPPSGVAPSALAPLAASAPAALAASAPAPLAPSAPAPSAPPSVAASAPPPMSPAAPAPVAVSASTPVAVGSSAPAAPAGLRAEPGAPRLGAEGPLPAPPSPASSPAPQIAAAETIASASLISLAAAEGLDELAPLGVAEALPSQRPATEVADSFAGGAPQAAGPAELSPLGAQPATGVAEAPAATGAPDFADVRTAPLSLDALRSASAEQARTSEVGTAPSLETAKPSAGVTSGPADEPVIRTPSAPWVSAQAVELPAPGLASDLSEGLVVPVGPVARQTPVSLDAISPGASAPPSPFGLEDLLDAQIRDDAARRDAVVEETQTTEDIAPYAVDSAPAQPVVTSPSQAAGPDAPPALRMRVTTSDLEPISEADAELKSGRATLPVGDDLLETQDDGQIPAEVLPKVQVATIGPDEPLHIPVRTSSAGFRSSSPDEHEAPVPQSAVPIDLTTADIADVVDLDGSLDFDAIVTWDTEIEGRRAFDLVELISTGAGEAQRARAAAEEALRIRLESSSLGSAPIAEAPPLVTDSDDVQTRTATYIPIRPLGTRPHPTLHLVCRYAPDGSAAPCVLRWMDDARGLSWQTRRARFLTEADIGKRLRHPNVVRVHDAGERRERPFLIREFISGASLRELTDNAGGVLPVPVVVTIARQVADGLRYVHAKSDTDGAPLHLVHGELSPDAILVSLDGVAKITAVGVTRIGDQILRGPIGGRKGHAGYGAPEQLQGLAIDARADLFALGAIIAELVIGRPLLSDRSTRLDALEEEIWSACANRDDVPGPLVELIVKMTKRSCEQRPANAGAVADALTEISEQLGGSSDLAVDLAPLFAMATPVVPVSVGRSAPAQTLAAGPGAKPKWGPLLLSVAVIMFVLAVLLLLSQR